MAIKTSELMKAARKEAIARLRAMSFEELLERSIANQGSTTVEFLTACKAGFPVITETTTEKTVMSEEFTVGVSAYAHASYSRSSAFAAATAFCCQAWKRVAASPIGANDLLLPAAA